MMPCADAKQLRAHGIWDANGGSRHADAPRNGLSQGQRLLHAPTAAAHGSHCACTRSQGEHSAVACLLLHVVHCPEDLSVSGTLLGQCVCRTCGP